MKLGHLRIPSGMVPKYADTTDGWAHGDLAISKLRFDA